MSRRNKIRRAAWRRQAAPPAECAPLTCREAAAVFVALLQECWEEITREGLLPGLWKTVVEYVRHPPYDSAIPPAASRERTSRGQRQPARR